MTYTVLTRTIAGLTSGQIGAEYIGSPILFVIGGATYFGTIETIATLTSITLLASSALPATGGTVTTVTLIDMSVYYCSQDDIEKRVGVPQLAQLTNDTANTTVPDATIVLAIIQKSCAEIDSKAGQVWQTPFTVPTNCDSIPSLIKQIAIDYSIYYCFLRRFTEIDVPKQWVELYKDAKQKLDDVSNMLVQLDGNPTVLSGEANMVSNTPLIDFNDQTSSMSLY